MVTLRSGLACSPGAQAGAGRRSDRSELGVQLGEPPVLAQQQRGFSLDLLGFALPLLHSLLVSDRPILDFNRTWLDIDDRSPVEQLLLFGKALPTQKTASQPSSTAPRATRSNTPTC